MVFEIICFAGLVFVVLTLPGALRRRGGVAHRISPMINDASPNLTDTNVLAADRAEYYELLEKHSADP